MVPVASLVKSIQFDMFGHSLCRNMVLIIVADTVLVSVAGTVRSVDSVLQLQYSLVFSYLNV